MFMNTGSQIAGRPSMGSWITYGLGQRGREPARVRRADVSLGKGRRTSRSRRGSGAAASCPSRFQGVPVRGQGGSGALPGQPRRSITPSNRGPTSRPSTRSTPSTTLVDDPEIATRIAQYEMAFRMQASVPELIDVRGEGRKTLELYGCQPGDGSFASNCLLARRLAERGVRFIQLYHRDWDHHAGVKEELALAAQEIDRACTALITDLKQPGHARRHADRLGRRVRPHADVAAQGPTAATTTTRRCRSGSPAAASRRASSTARPTSSATPRSRTSARCTTSTRRCCTSCGIDHDAFSVKFQGLDAKLTGVEGAKVIKDILI